MLYVLLITECLSTFVFTVDNIFICQAKGKKSVGRQGVQPGVDVLGNLWKDIFLKQEYTQNIFIVIMCLAIDTDIRNQHPGTLGTPIAAK